MKQSQRTQTARRPYLFRSKVKGTDAKADFRVVHHHLHLAAVAVGHRPPVLRQVLGEGVKQQSTLPCLVVKLAVDAQWCLGGQQAHDSRSVRLLALDLRFAK